MVFLSTLDAEDAGSMIVLEIARQASEGANEVSSGVQGL